MAFIQWEEKYKLGIGKMDAQHEKWLAILNKFYEQLETGDVNEKLKSLLDEAIVYTTHHFDEEEKFMTEIKYPNLADQQKKHGEIKDKLNGFKEQLNSGKLLISSSVTREMKRWFNEHIIQEDKKYGEYYKNKAK